MIYSNSTSLDKRIIIFAGGYGSGKTEVAVNFTVRLAQARELPLSIIDLDIVNPYFRSREAAHPLLALGVNVICPRGGQCTADLPIILPEIKGAIESTEGRVVIDVGGDDVGARVLGSLAKSFRPDDYEFLLVLNANRPFTADVAGSLKMIEAIEFTSRLKVTGIVSNTHLIEETTGTTVLEGLLLAKSVGQMADLPVKLVCAKKEVLDAIPREKLGCETLPLERFMLKPWEVKGGPGQRADLV